MKKTAKVMFLAIMLTLPVAGAQAQDPLNQFVGKWKAMVNYTSSGGRFTVSLAEPVEVKQPNKNTIEFSVKPVTSAEPVFNARLTYDVKTKAYSFNVTMDDATRAKPSVLENLKLTYNETTGFAGEGLLIDPGGTTRPVNVQVKRNDKGEYEWTVRNPSAPAGDDIVFSFSFFERIK